MIVLWFVALLSILAIGFSRSVRTEIQIAYNLVEDTRDRHLADAAVQMGIHQLLKSTRDELSALVSGVPRDFLYDGRRLSYSIRDERGKLDINQAPDELLLNLLQGSGMDPVSASGVLDAIADWRDENDLKRLNGAERPEYEQAGLNAVPTNMPFVSVAELQQVIGIDTELYKKLEPYTTVHGFNDQINPRSASDQVLQALPEAKPEEVENIIAERNRASEDGTDVPTPVLTGVDGWISNETGPTFSIRGLAKAPSRSAFARELVIWIADGEIDNPYLVLDSHMSARVPEVGLE